MRCVSMLIRLLTLLAFLLLPACRLPAAGPLAKPATVHSTSDQKITAPVAKPQAAFTHLSGRVDYPEVRRSQATIGNAIDSATVTLLDTAGSVLSSGLTDRNGVFRLDVGFVPATGVAYLLESAKGLANAAPGSTAARLRTIVQWNGSTWLSISNADATTPLVLNALTTAVALEAALDAARVAPSATIGKVNAVANPATLNAAPTYTGHADSEMATLAGHVVSYLSEEQDPVESVSNVAPLLTSLSQGSAGVGTLITLSGKGFVPLPGQTTVSFNGAAATVYLVTATRIVAAVPVEATDGNVTVTTPFGTSGGQAFALATAAVTVYPGAFGGNWKVVGIHNQWQSGNQTSTLNVGGTYTLSVDGFDSFAFQVGAGGTVTATGSAAGGANRLDFNTQNVTVSPNQNSQQWSISGLTSWQFGTRTVTVLKNNAGTLNVNGLSAPVKFSVDGSGVVTPTTGMATGGTGTLSLTVTNVAFNLGGYSGQWTLSGVGTQSGNATLTLVRGGSYSMTLTGAQIPIVFTLDASGNVTVPGSQATGGAGSLTVTTSDVVFNTNGYSGSWALSSLFTGSGNQTLKLARNQRYAIDLGTGGSVWTPLDVDGSGNVALSSPSASGGAATVTFNTQVVVVNPNGYSGVWGGSLTGGYVNGSRNLVALKGGTYSVNCFAYDCSNGFTFSVASDGTVTPSNPGMATGGVGTLTFNTLAVTINLNGCTDAWAASSADNVGWRGNNAVVNFVKGCTYSIMTGYTSINYVQFNVGTDGVIRVLGGSLAGTVSGATLNLPVASVTINPGSFTGSWYTSGTGWTGGSRVVPLILGSYNTVNTYGGGFSLRVNKDGTISLADNNSATLSGTTVTFRTVTTTVSTGATTWLIDGVTGSNNGTAVVTLVCGMNNWNFYRSAGSSRRVETRANGSAAPASFTLDGFGFNLSP